MLPWAMAQLSLMISAWMAVLVVGWVHLVVMVQPLWQLILVSLQRLTISFLLMACPVSPLSTLVLSSLQCLTRQGLLSLAMKVGSLVSCGPLLVQLRQMWHRAILGSRKMLAPSCRLCPRLLGVPLEWLRAWATQVQSRLKLLAVLPRGGQTGEWHVRAVVARRPWL